MILHKKIFDNVFLIKNHLFFDNRGSLVKFYNSTEKKTLYFKQFFVTKNKKKGTIRGFHFQKYPFYETKLVSVIKGRILDIVIDIRKNSKTKYQKKSTILSEKSPYSLLIGKGFAHGYQTLESDTIVSYLVAAEYKPKHQSGIIYNDPFLNIKWPIKKITISKKDLSFKKI